MEQLYVNKIFIWEQRGQNTGVVESSRCMQLRTPLWRKLSCNLSPSSSLTTPSTQSSTMISLLSMYVSLVMYLSWPSSFTSSPGFDGTHHFPEDLVCSEDTPHSQKCIHHNMLAAMCQSPGCQSDPLVQWYSMLHIDIAEPLNGANSSMRTKKLLCHLLSVHILFITLSNHLRGCSMPQTMQSGSSIALQLFLDITKFPSSRAYSRLWWWPLNALPSVLERRLWASVDTHTTALWDWVLGSLKKQCRHPPSDPDICQSYPGRKHLHQQWWTEHPERALDHSDESWKNCYCFAVSSVYHVQLEHKL